MELFSISKECFNGFREEWSFNVFIFGAEYHKVKAEKPQLLNFLKEEAKLAIYITRRNRVRGKCFKKSVCCIS